MKSGIFVLVALCIFSLRGFSAPTTQNSKAPVEFIKITEAWISYYLQKKDFVKADKRLAWSKAKFPNDPEFEIMRGTILASREDLKGAAGVYRSVASASEIDADAMVRGKSLYMLAQVEKASGNVSASESTLAEMAEDPAFGPAANTATYDLRANRPFSQLDEVKILSAIRSQKPGWSSFVTVTSGYDSNVSLLPDTVGDKPGSAYVTPSATLTHRGRLSGSSFDTSGTVGYTRNLEEDLKSNNSLPVSLNALWVMPGESGWLHKLSLAYDGSATFVETSGLTLFSNSNSLRPQREFSYGLDSKLIVGLPVTYTAYPGTGATGEEVRDGLTYGANVSNLHYSGRFQFSETAGYSRQESQGDNFKSDSWSLAASADTKLVEKISAQLTAGLTLARYPQAATDRSDTQYSAGLSLSRPFSSREPIFGSIGGNYLKSNSNVAQADYAKQVYFLKVTYETR